ncbi:MAG: lamin tail domain-containing protein [Gelidibacter sp.]
MINKYSFFVMVFLCAIMSGFGQVTIYYENMYNGTGGASGNPIATHETNNRFNEDGLTYSGTGDMRTSNPSTAAYAGASGTWNAMLNSNTETFIMDGLNMLGYNSTTLSVGIRKSTLVENGSGLIIEYSSTGIGGTYTSLSWGSLPTGPGTVTWYLMSGISIPNTVTTLRFRSTNTVEWRIDDILLEGIACTDAVDWANIQFPNTSPQNMVHNGTFDVYARVYEPGVTPPAGFDTAITAEIGYSSTNNNPNLAGWTWIPATFNAQYGNDDEYTAEIGSGLAPGTYYYASRFNLNNCGYVYGGTGGIWNNDSVELIVTADQVDFCNVDYPKMGTAVVGGTFNVYTQAYEPGLTNADPFNPAPGLQAWIGYSSTDIPPYTSPASWTWMPATYDSDFVNNDQFVANIIGGANGITTPGTYYFASRWQLNGSLYSYGGILDDNMGNFWDPVTYNNGILTVTNPPCSDIIISEYVEGSGNNKYLEIFNGTGAAINLANYQIRVYSNGSATPTTTANLSGTIPNGGVIVYRNPSAVIYGGATTVLTPNPITFNGDDAVALVNNGNIIDVIGQIGFDPGTEWTGGSVSTLDRTLIRKSTVQVGDADGYNAFSPNAEWQAFPINSVSELGYHFSSCYPDRELNWSFLSERLSIVGMTMILVAKLSTPIQMLF